MVETMLVSTHGKTLQAHKAVADAALQRVQRTHERITRLIELVAAVTEDAPIPEEVILGGYCADGALRFRGAGQLSLLMNLYPPLDTIVLSANNRLSQ